MSLAIGAGIVGNILSVVGVVITNKYIIEKDGFNFSVFLSFLHFAFTSISTNILLYSNQLTYKSAPINCILPVALGSLLSVAFMNLNLAFNSVGLYQLSKLVCIPVTLIIQYIFYGQTVSRKIQITLIPITFGVGYATVYDLDLNMLGLIFACCGIIATAASQIFVNVYQKTMDCNALQLLHLTSPYIALGMLILCPLFDDVHALSHFQFTSGCIFRILVSCLFAIGVNITNYFVIGKTSPLTYQVLGHLKTILILLLGFMFFNKTVDLRNVIGITIAMVGVIAYTEMRRQTSNPSTPTLPVTNQNK